jgi:hypothetical protein
MLPLLIDENLNHRILRGLLRSLPHLNYLLATAAGLKGAEDPVLLDFAAKENRVLVSHDLRTIPKHAYERIRAGLPLPGVIAVPDELPIGKVVADLALIVECATQAEMESVVIYLPL